MAVVKWLEQFPLNLREQSGGSTIIQVPPDVFLPVAGFTFADLSITATAVTGATSRTLRASFEGSVDSAYWPNATADERCDLTAAGGWSGRIVLADINATRAAAAASGSTMSLGAVLRVRFEVIGFTTGESLTAYVNITAALKQL